MTGFEPQTSDIGSNPSTNLAATTAPENNCLDRFQSVPISLWLSNIMFFLNWPTPASFHLFLVFPNKHYKFLQQIDGKNVHPVYSAGIRTHNLWNVSLLP